jgi:Protein of unknown function (DUF2849)
MPFVLKANDLRGGAVLYWTGSQWTPRLADGKRFDSEEATQQEAARDGVRLTVVDVYPVAVTDSSPASLRERINAVGPTVRPDLCRSTGA